MTPAGKRETILVIDDDDVFGQVLEDVLDSLGYQVKRVGSLARAPEALESVTYDLVLTDLCVSGDGYGLLITNIVSSLRAEIPLLFITRIDGQDRWLVTAAEDHPAYASAWLVSMTDDLPKLIEVVLSKEGRQLEG